MRHVVKYLDDILLLAGGGCVVYGLSMWSIPLAWIVGGLMLIVLAMMMVITKRGEV